MVSQGAKSIVTVVLSPRNCGVNVKLPVDDEAGHGGDWARAACGRIKNSSVTKKSEVEEDWLRRQSIKLLVKRAGSVFHDDSSIEVISSQLRLRSLLQTMLHFFDEICVTEILAN